MDPARVPQSTTPISARATDNRRCVGNVAVHGLLGRVSEKRCQGVEVLRRDGVKLVVMAGGTTDGQAQPNCACGIDAILSVHGLDLFEDDAAFIGGSVATVEA